MGEKDSISKIESEIVLTVVNPECERCHKKIERALRKIKDAIPNTTISNFPKRKPSVTISGAFNGKEICERLRCMAGPAIKEMKLVINTDFKPSRKEENHVDANFDLLFEKILKDLGLPVKDDKHRHVDFEPVQALLDKLLQYFGYRRRDDMNDEPIEAEYKLLLDKVLQDLGYRPRDSGPNAAGTGTPPLTRGEPIAPAPVQAAQVVAAPSVWPAPASSLAGYSYNPSYYDPSYYGGGGYSYNNPSYDDPSYYYGGSGYDSHGCGCGYGPYCCRCGKPEPDTPGAVYYGVPMYDNQGCGTTRSSNTGTGCTGAVSSDGDRPTDSQSLSNQWMTVWSPYHS